MTLVIDRRAEFAGKPGFHALIVGVGGYPHLPATAEETPPPAAFGMRQLSSTSLTAYKVYTWLEEHAERLNVPLVTCRLLLTPTAAEIAAQPELNGLAEPAALTNFQLEINAWRADGATSKDNVTFFYFAGHGIQRNKSDAIILLQDFGNGVGGALFHAVDVNHVFNGMAPSDAQPAIALNQFYFIDACRNLPAQIKNFEQQNTSDVFNVELSGRDDRCAPIFYAAVAGSKAYALKGEQTVFSKALLACLGNATDDPEEDEQGQAHWPVTVQSLNSALTKHFEQLTPQEKSDQDFILGGWVKNAVIHYLDSPPPVAVSVEIAPSDALPVTALEFRDGQGNVAKAPPTPLAENPYRDVLPAGFYRLVATVTPPFVNRERLVPVMPPSKSLKVTVTP